MEKDVKKKAALTGIVLTNGSLTDDFLQDDDNGIDLAEEEIPL